MDCRRRESEKVLVTWAGRLPCEPRVCTGVCVLERDRQTWVSRAGLLYSVNVYVSDFSTESIQELLVWPKG